VVGQEDYDTSYSWDSLHGIVEQYPEGLTVKSQEMTKEV